MSDSFAPGLYTTAAPPDAVAADWRLAGWSPRILRVDLVDHEDAKRQVIRAVGASLGFPASYGANLDALWDGLRDVPGSTVLIWVGGSKFADAHPGVWDAVGATLVERTRSRSPFAVVLCGTGAPHV